MLSAGKKTVLSSFGLFFLSVFWGLSFVIVKDSLDVIPSFYILAFRFTIAAVGLCIIFHRKFKLLNKSSLFHGALLGLFLFFGFSFQTFGCRYTTAGKNAFLTTVYVVAVPLLNWAMYRKKPGWNRAFAALLAFVGAGFLSLDANFSVNIGDALTLVCGVAYAVHIVLIDHYTEKQDPLLLAVLQVTTCAVLSWIAALTVHGGFNYGALSTRGWLSMAYLGIVSTMIAYILQNVCQKYTHPTTASLLMSLESVFGMLFSVLLLHESLTLKIGIGCGLMFVAILVSECSFNRLKRTNRSEKEDIKCSSK